MGKEDWHCLDRPHPHLTEGTIRFSQNDARAYPRWGQHTILHWMSSPICIELKRSPDLQSMHTPPAAEAGLESEKFIECDVGDGRNAGAIGTHANSHQSGLQSLVPTDGVMPPT